VNFLSEKREINERSLTNVVYILTDDQGVWAAGCYGNSEIRTPNIDRLARTGVEVSSEHEVMEKLNGIIKHMSGLVLADFACADVDRLLA